MNRLLLILLLLNSCVHKNGKLETAILVQSTKGTHVSIVDSSTVNTYLWLDDYQIENALVNRIPVPDEFERIDVEEKSFADWLRHLPLKDGNPDILNNEGEKISSQNHKIAVVDIDVGEKDLQQCADAVMRLRAEFLHSTEQDDLISFNFTSGDACAWNSWKHGSRPHINGNDVSWSNDAATDESYKNFRKYMDMVFNYAGSLSLSKEMNPIEAKDIYAGDVFIQGGSPGHAVTILDVAMNSSGDKIFLIAQSYMPAQNIHVLRNFTNADLSPWYKVNEGNILDTPQWNFDWENAMRF